jgi:hypothetical protein
MNYFPKIDNWHVPRDILAEALEEMGLDGVRGNEGICLWLGSRSDDGNAPSPMWLCFAVPAL